MIQTRNAQEAKPPGATRVLGPVTGGDSRDICEVGEVDNGTCSDSVTFGTIAPAAVRGRALSLSRQPSAYSLALDLALALALMFMLILTMPLVLPLFIFSYIQHCAKTLGFSPSQSFTSARILQTNIMLIVPRICCCARFRSFSKRTFQPS